MGQKIRDVHRTHLGAQARDQRREVPIGGCILPAGSSVAMAQEIMARGPSPSQVTEGAELKARLEQALESLDGIDREIIALRHVEDLSNIETARVLGINEDAASKRHVRALRRLKERLSGLSGFFLEG